MAFNSATQLRTPSFLTRLRLRSNATWLNFTKRLSSWLKLARSLERVAMHLLGGKRALHNTLKRRRFPLGNTLDMPMSWYQLRTGNEKLLSLQHQAGVFRAGWENSIKVTRLLGIAPVGSACQSKLMQREDSRRRGWQRPARASVHRQERAKIRTRTSRSSQTAYFLLNSQPERMTG
ncbi:uncharacterized protein SPSC_03446 [Sporisorium scitamineum]|uniref:Uncharacterized protein n=1 Tax=Sporisorium scitamineum TaxID=49012 RepID=A0A140KMV5_9BASI|nr:uncharacterized protein SPSC_03446 [Sporisorium scitamineum]